MHVPGGRERKKEREREEDEREREKERWSEERTERERERRMSWGERRGGGGERDRRVLKGEIFSASISRSRVGGGAIPYDSGGQLARMYSEDRSHGDHAHLSVFRGCRSTRPASRAGIEEEKKIFFCPAAGEIFRG